MSDPQTYESAAMLLYMNDRARYLQKVNHSNVIHPVQKQYQRINREPKLFSSRESHSKILGAPDWPEVTFTARSCVLLGHPPSFLLSRACSSKHLMVANLMLCE